MVWSPCCPRDSQESSPVPQFESINSSVLNLKFSPVIQSCLTLCDPMDCSTPGFPVYHQLLEVTQTHAHWVGDAIQPSHPLPPPSPPALNLSQHQDWLITSGGQSIGASASILPIDIQLWFPLVLNGLISLLSKGLSRVFSSTTVWKDQLFGTQPSLWFKSHICSWFTGKPTALTIWNFVGKVISRGRS